MDRSRAARVLSVLLSLVLLLGLCAGLTGCKKKPIGLVVVYVGPDVTTTDRVFTEEDFTVLANYDDGTDEYVHDYTFEQTDLREGYYVFMFHCRGYDSEAYVRCRVPIFASDMEGSEG